jgi:hypothetical protein
MYAILRQFPYDPRKLADGKRALAEVQALHAGQPGYAGSLVIDDGQRFTAVNLWYSEQAADAGREAIGPSVQRLIEPLMAGPSELLAAGEVLVSDTEEQS